MVVLFWQGVGAGHEGNETSNLVHDTWLRAGGELYMYSGKDAEQPQHVNEIVGLLA